MNNESSSACMCAYKFIFGLYFVNSLVAFVTSQSYRFIYASHLAKFLKVEVHCLVTDYRQCFVVFQRNILILGQDS